MKEFMVITGGDTHIEATAEEVQKLIDAFGKRELVINEEPAPRFIEVGGNVLNAPYIWAIYTREEYDKRPKSS